MERLQSRIIPAGPRLSLLDALVSIALPHSYGVLDLSSQVLAEALEITRVELEAYVLLPLGEEAAISYASGRIVVRHELIADAIVDICIEDRYDLAGAVRRVVRAAAARISRSGYTAGLGSLAYISSRIEDLPELALAAADAAIEAAPDRLSYRTFKSSVLRGFKRTRDAAAIGESSLSLLQDADNSSQARSFLTEWGVVEGMLGNFGRNAVLAGIALQDSPALGRIRESGCHLPLSGLLLALRRLQEAEPDPDLLAGLAAVSVVARQLSRGIVTTWLRDAERLVERNEVPFPSLRDGSAVDRGLRAGLLVARARLERPFPPQLPRMDFSFRELREFVRG